MQLDRPGPDHTCFLGSSVSPGGISRSIDQLWTSQPGGSRPVLVLTIIAVTKNKTRQFASTGPASFLSLDCWGSLELQQRVDSDRVPSVIASYNRAKGSLATIKIFHFYAGKSWARQPASRGTTLPSQYGPLELKLQATGRLLFGKGGMVLSDRNKTLLLLMVRPDVRC